MTTVAIEEEKVGLRVILREGVNKHLTPLQKEVRGNTRGTQEKLNIKQRNWAEWNLNPSPALI